MSIKAGSIVRFLPVKIIRDKERHGNVRFGWCEKMNVICGLAARVLENNNGRLAIDFIEKDKIPHDFPEYISYSTDMVEEIKDAAFLTKRERGETR